MHVTFVWMSWVFSTRCWVVTWIRILYKCSAVFTTFSSFIRHGVISCHHRRSQDFVWGALFFPEKVDDLFSWSTSKHTLKCLNNFSHRPDLSNLLKMDSFSALGCTYNFPLQIPPPIFAPPWGYTSHVPAGYAYGCHIPAHVKTIMIIMGYWSWRQQRNEQRRQWWR